MTRYVTVDSLRDLLSRNESTYVGDNLNDTDLATRIVEAESEVDAALGRLYTVPFTPVPPIIADITLGIAAFLADLSDRQTRDMDTTDPIWLRYQRARSLLRDLASGTAQLPPGTPTPPDSTGTGYGRAGSPIHTYDGSLFTRERFGV